MAARAANRRSSGSRGEGEAGEGLVLLGIVRDGNGCVVDAGIGDGSRRTVRESAK